MTKMKHTALMALLLAVALFSSCSSQPADPQAESAQPRTTVTLTKVRLGKIENDIVVTATTAYLRKSTISAPISGFIVRGAVEPGMRTVSNQLLFTLETKEHHALQGSNSTLPSGYTAVRTGRSGIVTEVMQQTGSFVTEGTPLCTLAEAGSMVFLLNIPPEEMHYFPQGGRCTIQLPDSLQLEATVGSPLGTMNTASQVQQVVAQAHSGFLPEGLNVKAVAHTSQSKTLQMILPKGAVQSDDQMQHFWVMKLADDSTAVRVPVSVGNRNTDSIEVASPQLSPQDKIILNGSYALEDHAFVTIAK